MRLTIHHQTNYVYQAAPKHLIQIFRLSPRLEPHQRIVEWQMTAPGKLTVFTDAFGNVSHSHVLQSPNDKLTLTAAGVVEITALNLGRLPPGELQNSVPTLSYLVSTPLTESFAKLDLLTHTALPHGLHNAQDALALAAAICQVVQYAQGNTDVTSTAEQAYELAMGVCQDHAHLMIAACRSLDVPARYVSGYVDPGNSRAAASHAWVDVWLQDHWLSVDVTNALLVTDAHCRLAIGRDYLDACPIRGVREGGQTEQLNVTVTVHTA